MNFKVTIFSYQLHEQHSDLPCSTSTPSQSLSSSILRDKIKKLEFQRCRRVTTIEKNENFMQKKSIYIYISLPFLTHNTETKKRDREREFFSLELDQASYFETEHHKAHKVLQVESSHGRYFVLFVRRGTLPLIYSSLFHHPSSLLDFTTIDYLSSLLFFADYIPFHRDYSLIRSRRHEIQPTVKRRR